MPQALPPPSAPPRPAPGVGLAPPRAARGETSPALRVRATLMLLAATAVWGLSFPLTKAVQIAQGTTLIPEASTWFLAGVGVLFRFGAAAVILALGAARTLRTVTRLELVQGFGLGVLGGGGLLLQVDGLNYTAASTSAFLTSCFCVLVPVIVAVERRRWPAGRVVLACGLVTAGLAILAGVDPRELLRLGRGEAETLLSACFFAGQIWWVERPEFARNRTSHNTLVMFTVVAALGAATVAIHSPGGAPAREFAAACASWPVLGMLLVLTVFCTLCTFTVMNHWQRHVEATQAGLIYCGEPVFTSVFTLFLPALLAGAAGIVYANESLTPRLLLGGGLITLANVVVQLGARRKG